jgi:TrmH family RNA methyltransferase
MFVIGSEGKGISEEVVAEIKEYTSIPILGQAESLNAAMATGIILYEVVRQRNT